MRRAMVGADAVAALGVDLLVVRLADRELARDDLGAQHVKLAERFERVLNFAKEALESGKFSSVADLPAAFRIERRLVGQNFDGLADFGMFDALSVPDDGEHHPLA